MREAARIGSNNKYDETADNVSYEIPAEVH